MLMLKYRLHIEAVQPHSLGCIDITVTPFHQQLSNSLTFEVQALLYHADLLTLLALVAMQFYHIFIVH